MEKVKERRQHTLTTSTHSCSSSRESDSAIMTPGGRPVLRTTVQAWVLAAEERVRILRREVMWWVLMRARNGILGMRVGTGKG
jgi:hypothetical protein